MAACACSFPARSSGREPTPCFARLRLRRLGCPYEDVEIAQPDTTEVPNSGPTVASRTAMVVGNWCSPPREDLKQTLTASGMLGDNLQRGGIPRGLPRVRCRARPISIAGALRAAGEYLLGRPKLSGRGVRGVCVGGLRGGSHGGSDDVQRHGGRFRGAAGSRQSIESGFGARDKLSAASRRGSDSRCTKKWNGGTAACRMAR